VLLDILQSGATAAEVLEALTWASAVDQIATETETDRTAPSFAFARSCSERN
jgi:hypothetical protein